jgi:hypothetical protein
MKKRGLLLLTIAIFTVLSFAHAQIPSYVPTNGLLAWWGFNNNGNDLSINNNHFTNYGMTYVTDRFNNPASAVTGNGSTQYMQCATPSFSLGANSSFTISFWMLKPSNTSGVAMMHGTTVAGNFIWNFQTGTTGNVQFGTNKQQSAWIWTLSTHGVNTWEHFLATYNNGAITLYKNGVSVATNVFTHTAVTQAIMPIWLGRGVSGSYFSGSFDDMGMWNRVLTQQEITDLYNSAGCTNTFSSVTASACYSFTWPQNNQTYTQSGNYTDTLMNHLGCDSIITLNLTINPNTTATQYHLACDTFTWINGLTYTTSVDTVTYIIPNAAGCDSIITLDLTIVNLHVTQQPTDIVVHTGTSAVFEADASPAVAVYRWQIFTGGSFQYLMDTGQYSGALTPVLTVANIKPYNHMQQYRCVVTIGACGDTSHIALIVVSDIGMDETKSTGGIRVYPNPATGSVYLAADISLVGTPFVISDQSGRVVLTGTIEDVQTKIHLENLPGGLYMISTGEQMKNIFRVVKQ